MMEAFYLLVGMGEIKRLFGLYKRQISKPTSRIILRKKSRKMTRSILYNSRHLKSTSWKVTQRL